MKEPAHTCPLIDKAILAARDGRPVRYVLRQSDDIEEIRRALSEADDALAATEDYYEKIREANLAIREWGSHHECEAVALRAEVERLRAALEEVYRGR